MKVRTLASVALGTSMILAIGGVLAMADSPMAVHATLSGYQEVPAISTTGEGDFKAEIGAHAIRYRLRFDDLEGGDVLFAHIHLGRPATNGGVVAFLCGGGDAPVCPKEGTVQGTIMADDVIGPAEQGIDAGEFRELVRAIRRNATYVNVHTEDFPSGELRGNVIDP